MVAEGATAREPADKTWFPDVHGWRASVQRWIDDAQFGLTDLLTDAPPAEVWVVPDAWHTGGLAVVPAEWERRVIDFVAHALDVA